MASRSTDASPKVRLETLPSPSDAAAGIAEGLIDPVASPAALRSTRLPQHGVEFAASQRLLGPLATQRERNSPGWVPPCARSYWISMSPALRTGVTPLPLTVVDWLNSKSMLVVPVGSCTRCQNMCMKFRPLGVVSW